MWGIFILLILLTRTVQKYLFSVYIAHNKTIVEDTPYCIHTSEDTVKTLKIQMFQHEMHHFITSSAIIKQIALKYFEPVKNSVF